MVKMIFSDVVYASFALLLLPHFVLVSSCEDANASMQKRAPLPSNLSREVKKPARGFFSRIAGRQKAVEPIEEVAKVEEIQDTIGTSYTPPDEIEEEEQFYQESLKRPYRRLFTYGERLKIWRRLLRDLLNVPDIDREYNKWRDEVNDARRPFWDTLPSEGTISWRIHARPEDPEEVYQTVMRDAKRLERPWRQPGAFILDLEYDSVQPWPQLQHPQYAYFQHRYEEHLQRAKALLEERNRMVLDHSGGLEDIKIFTHEIIEGDDPHYDLKEYLKEITSDITTKFKAEATRAFDIFHVLQLTYRNIRAEQDQASTLATNREHKWPDALVYNDKGSRMYLAGQPDPSLLDD